MIEGTQTGMAQQIFCQNTAGMKVPEYRQMGHIVPAVPLVCQAVQPEMPQPARITVPREPAAGITVPFQAGILHTVTVQIHSAA